MKILLSLVLLLILAIPQSSFAQKKTPADLLKLLSNEEKIKLVVGTGMKFPGASIGLSEDRVPGSAGSTAAFPAAGIPKIVVADGPAGLRISPFHGTDSSRSYYATAFPIGTLLASSWDADLVKKVGEAYGEEARDYGVDVVLGPALNNHRNPLGGRNFEYYSEDPFVAGNITSSMVNGIQSKGIGVSIKHFALNNHETNRMQMNVIVSERALREVYLRSFEIAVKKSDPWTIMSSYNRVNGTYTSESKDLLTTILRNEWGYKGMVMTDWFGGADATAQIAAGNDLLMPGTPEQEKKLNEDFKSGRLSQADLDRDALRVLELIEKTITWKNYKYSDKPALLAHAKVARQAASEGMVLLKNQDGALPFKKGMKLAAFGITSYNLITGGTGSGDVNEAYSVSLTEGLHNAGFSLDEGLALVYKTYLADAIARRPKPVSFFMPQDPLPEMSADESLISKSADQNDAALLTIGRNSGEFRDRKLDNDYLLNEVETALIKKVAAAYHAKGKKLIVILNIGGVIDVASWRDQADAILLAWQGGQEGGNAIADVLCGTVNPSGKLATSFPVKYMDLPSSKNFPGREVGSVDVKGPLGMSQGKAMEVVYEEGIYNGYRYFNSFHVDPAYPFGFGLSYTGFAYSKLQVSNPDAQNNVTVTAVITNTGKVPGKEVVQLYLSAPAGSIGKPAEELKGFVKTGLLKPGQSQTVRFKLTPDEMASFVTDASAWVAFAGQYTVKLGASSRDFRAEGGFELKKELVTEKCNKVMVPQVKIEELSAK